MLPVGLNILTETRTSQESQTCPNSGQYSTAQINKGVHPSGGSGRHQNGKSLGRRRVTPVVARSKEMTSEQDMKHIQIKEVLLQVVEEYSHKGSQFQQNSVLIEAARRLGISHNEPLEQALLTAWHDRFREGQLAWGHDLLNPDAPFCHLTNKGRETLSIISRDPSNVDGYVAHLKREASLNSIADSYITEALQAYNSNCFKAAAVMVGCASESLSLEIRDDLVNKMTALGKVIPNKLNDWRIRTVITAIKTELDSVKSNMDVKLRESYESYWPAFTQQIRAIRNEAGHPASVNPVTDSSVHASLLIFPELVVLCENIRSWINSSYA